MASFIPGWGGGGGLAASLALGSVAMGSEPGGHGLLRGAGQLDAGDGIAGRLPGGLAVELVEPDLDPLAHVVGSVAVLADDLFGGWVSQRMTQVWAETQGYLEGGLPDAVVVGCLAGGLVVLELGQLPSGGCVSVAKGWGPSQKRTPCLAVLAAEPGVDPAVGMAPAAALEAVRVDVVVLEHSAVQAHAGHEHGNDHDARRDRLGEGDAHHREPPREVPGEDGGLHLEGLAAVLGAGLGRPAPGGDGELVRLVHDGLGDVAALHVVVQVLRVDVAEVVRGLDLRRWLERLTKLELRLVPKL